MNNTPEIPINCLFQGCYNPELEKHIRICKDKCYRYNQLNPNAKDKQQEMLKELLGSMGNEVVITPPFWCDYGYNISVGDYFYSNHNLVITDGAKVVFGNNVFVAPNCCFTTAEHPIDAGQRRAGLEIAKPITVGNNVWIGTGATVLAGVTIGDNSVIGAGSVVTKSIPNNVVAVGVPCKVVKKITDDEKYRYPIFEQQSK
ncbi:MAG: sugar O-acetyltransferase [Eubacterium sp.]|nr:sugar O-acetyltransferase [Eubacterium sp.]